MAHPANAQSNSDVGQVLTGGPISVGAGDHALVCATNLGSAPVSVTMQLLNATSGAVVLQMSTTLGQTGTTSGPGTPGACLDSATASTAIIAVLIARVAVNPQPLPPQTVTLVASLQVLGMGTSGPLNPRVVALLPVHPPQPCMVDH
jgi:hypothetical protein